MSGLVTWSGLIEGLHKIFADDNIDVDEVKQLLNAYKSNPMDWRNYAKFDTHRYTRNLVDEGNGKFNLMILCWGEGMGSSIHDHSNSHCFVKVLDGSLKETLYAWPEDDADSEDSMKETSVNVYKRDGVAYINDTIGLHRMENPSHTDGSVTLHLYVPPFEKCMTFDQRTGTKRYCRVTFWSKYGERTALKVPESCVEAPVAPNTTNGSQ